MAGEFREFSSDETSSVIPHFEGSQPVAKAKKKEEPETAKAPLNTMQLPLSNTPIAPSPNVQDVTTAVTKANQQIQQNLPTPQAPSSVKELGKEVNQVGKSVGDMLMENWIVPAGILATYGAYKLLGEKPPSTVHPSEQPQPPSNKSIRDRMLLGEVKEPTFEAPVSTTSTPSTEAPPMSAPKGAELAEAGARNTMQNAVNQQLTELQKAGAVAPTAPAAPVAPVTPPVQPTVSQAIATGQSPTQAIETEVAKQIEAPLVEEKKRVGKKPGRKTAEEKAAIAAAIPPSEVGLTKQQIGLKRHLESFYGGGDIGSQAYQQVKDILGYTPEYPPGKGGGLQPEETSKILQYRKENIPGPKVNLTHDMKKALKAGGGAAILAAIPGFAEAKNLQEFGRNVGEALLPIGMTPSELASGTLTEKQLRAFQEAQKLGSPYRSVPPPR